MSMRHRVLRTLRPPDHEGARVRENGAMSEEPLPTSAAELLPVEDGEHLVISDGEGLAVMGESKAVERYLRKAGLWEASTSLDLRWLQPLLSFGADAAQVASEIAANSGRWVKLTKESAQDVSDHGLMDTKTPGVRWLMAGKPGDISKWLATETGAGATATNPVVLSGVESLFTSAAGVMAQLERKHEIAEIAELLTAIDEKLDDVRRAQRDGVLAKLDGVTFAIKEAMSIRERTGHVSETAWSKVQNLSSAIAEIESNALRALDALASKAKTKNKVGDLAQVSAEVVGEVEIWLSVLARCFQLHEEIAVLELDRVLEASPADLDGHRLALSESRDGLRGRITSTTVGLVARLDAAAGEADLQVLLHSRKSRVVVESSNHVGDSVLAFHRPLGIESERVSVSSTRWRDALASPEQLRIAAKEVGKKAAYGAAAVAFTAVSWVAVLRKDATNKGA